MTEMNKPVEYLDKGLSKRGNGWYKVPKTEKKKKKKVSMFKGSKKTVWSEACTWVRVREGNSVGDKRKE